MTKPDKIKIQSWYRGSNNKILYHGLKRAADIVLSSIGLVTAILLIAIFGLAIKIESKGSYIYSQKRVGKDGKRFTIYKLRSMYIDAEKDGIQWATKDDPRITRVGRFIRKTRIDEIPQFFNILKGDMSFVGPRPERPYFIQKFSQEIPDYICRLAVKPGLTGWAQVHGGYELTQQEKLQLDLYYIRNQSLWLDLKIILKTVVIVLTGEGAR